MANCKQDSYPATTGDKCRTEGLDGEGAVVGGRRFQNGGKERKGGNGDGAAS